MRLTNNRAGDPEAWGCLNDDQRDKIAEWYAIVCAESADARERDRKEEENRYVSSSIFALTPFVFAHALTTSASAFGWRTVIEAGAASVIYCFIFFAFQKIYSHLTVGKNKLDRYIITAVAMGISFLITFSVLINFGAI